MQPFSRCFALFGIGVALLTASAIHAMASAIKTASVKASCGPPNNYTAAFSGTGLNPADQYEVDFILTFSPPSPGSPIPVFGTATIPLKYLGKFSASASGSGNILTPRVTYTMTGSAILRDDTTGVKSNTRRISFTNTNNKIICAR
jgi:hypothetical protein